MSASENILNLLTQLANKVSDINDFITLLQYESTNLPLIIKLQELATHLQNIIDSNQTLAEDVKDLELKIKNKWKLCCKN